jgi:co-chaperonin GroES (HSP10)
MEPIEAEISDFLGATSLVVPQHLKQITRSGVARVVNIGTPLKNQPSLDVKPGDAVRFDNKFVEKYELWGKNYWIIKQERLLGKEYAN